MKIHYIFQLKDFLIILLVGLVIGAIYGLLNLPMIIKKHRILQIISDLLFSLIAYFTFLILINIINMGEFRLFLLIGYILGFVIERITIGKLFAKGFKKVYNMLKLLIKKFAVSKFGRAILK